MAEIFMNFHKFETIPWLLVSDHGAKSGETFIKEEN